MKHTEYGEIKLRFGDILFTWDDEKEKINICKHGLDFRTAASVFLDEDAVLEENSIDEYTGEERMDAIGSIGLHMLLFVVYVERITTDDDDIIRIISARRAVRKEIKRYVNGA